MLTRFFILSFCDFTHLLQFLPFSLLQWLARYGTFSRELDEVVLF